MRDAQFSSSLTSIDAQKYTHFGPNCAMWRFHDQVSMSLFINYLVARCRKQFCSAPCAFLHSFCPQNISVELKIIMIFREFAFFPK